MNHERLHIGDVRQQREDLQMIDEGLRLFLAAFDVEGEDRTGAVREITFVEFVIWMVRERRMVDFGNLRILLQIIHHLQRICHVTFDAQRQRFQSLQEQEGVERTDGRAGIAQDHRTDSCDVSCLSGCVGEFDAVITRFRFGQLREFTRSDPVEVA